MFTAGRDVRQMAACEFRKKEHSPWWCRASLLLLGRGALRFLRRALLRHRPIGGAHYNAHADSLPAQLSALAIATRMFGAKSGSRCALFPRIVDWFQQGGQKDSVPADETELGAAVASE